MLFFTVFFYYPEDATLAFLLHKESYSLNECYRTQYNNDRWTYADVAGNFELAVTIYE